MPFHSNIILFGSMFILFTLIPLLSYAQLETSPRNTNTTNLSNTSNSTSLLQQSNPCNAAAQTAMTCANTPPF